MKPWQVHVLGRPRRAQTSQDQLNSLFLRRLNARSRPFHEEPF